MKFFFVQCDQCKVTVQSPWSEPVDYNSGLPNGWAAGRILVMAANDTPFNMCPNCLEKDGIVVPGEQKK